MPKQTDDGYYGRDHYADHWNAKSRLPFGEHEGVQINRAPADYLEWVVRKEAGAAFLQHPEEFWDVIKKEIARRKGEEAEFMGTPNSHDYRTSTHSTYEEFKDAGETDKPFSSNWEAPKYPTGQSSDDAKKAAKSATDQTKKNWDAGGQFQCTKCNDSGLLPSSTYMGMRGGEKFCECIAGVRRELQKRNQEKSDLQLQLEREKRATRDAEQRARAYQGRRDGYDSFRDMFGGGVPKAGGVRKAPCLAIVAAGRKALAAKFHPDNNKSQNATELMARSNAAADWLEKCAEKLEE